MIACALIFSFYVILFLLAGWFWTTVALVVGAFVIYGFLSAQHDSKEQQKQADRLNRGLRSIKDFTPEKILQSPYSKNGIAIDTKRKKICLFTMHSSFRPKIYDFTNILAVEISEDGHTTIKTERTSQIVGAITGGLLLGGVGVVVGGLSGNKRSTNVVRRIDLRVTIDNIQTPINEITLFVQNESSSMDPTAARNVATHWSGVLSVIIKKTSREAESPPAENQRVLASDPLPSIADELKKLAELMSTGHITEAEYQKQKSRLLNP